MPKQGRRWKPTVCKRCGCMIAVPGSERLEYGVCMGGCGSRETVEVMSTQEYVDVLEGLAETFAARAAEAVAFASYQRKGEAFGFSQAAKEVRNLIEQGGAK